MAKDINDSKSVTEFIQNLENDTAKLAKIIRKFV
jgi:hypothetical protein